MSRGSELDYGPFLQHWTDQQLVSNGGLKGRD